MSSSQLQILAINLTRRCNLACSHCYLDAEQLSTPTTDELTTNEVQSTLDQVARNHPHTLVVLSGGEPLLRTDLEQLCSHAQALGLMVVIGSNGALLTERRVKSLKAAGVSGIGISLDSLQATHHDKLRGKPGSWKKTMAGIENCRKQQLDFQIHFSITDDNHGEIEDIIDFSEISGARVVNLFFIICTGRAKSSSNISEINYESSLLKIIELQQQHENIIIRPRCAPYFKRIAWQLDSGSALNRISGRDGDGCIAGIHYCRITAEGKVTACPYIETSVGNIKQQRFNDLWDTAPDFIALRNPTLKGKCGLCEFRQLCGGCRARPLADGKGLMDEDTSCGYIPQNKPVIEAITDFSAISLEWSQDALTRLNRIPGFIRAMVKKRIESYVVDLGERLITVEHMTRLSAKRFGQNPPWKRSANTDNST